MTTPDNIRQSTVAHALSVLEEEIAAKFAGHTDYHNHDREFLARYTILNSHNPAILKLWSDYTDDQASQ